MKKSEILRMLEPFDDDANIAFDGVTWLGEPEQICGKGQKYLPYCCVLHVGHKGQCYCGCKHVYFEPED